MMKSSSLMVGRHVLTAALIAMALVGLRPQCAAQTASALAPIALSPQRRQLIGVTLAEVKEAAVADALQTTGTIEADQRRESYVQTRFAGWIGRVYADQTWQHVSRGQPLFSIYSPDLVATEQEYLLALKARERVASSTVEGVAAGANSLVDSSLERLRLWGVPAGEIRRLERERRVRRELIMVAPAAGYLAERSAFPNMYVQPETRLFVIADFSTVWAYAAVFQSDAGRVRIGDPASLTVDAWPGERFDGNVDFIWPQVDPATRTVKVRVSLRNHGRKLAPGMFGRIALQLPLGRHLIIPDSGVLRTGLHNIVFIDRGDGYLTPQEVRLGPQVGDNHIVLGGLQAGQRIVSSANFLIDSESQLQAAMGNFAPPPPGAGGVAQPSSAGAQPGVKIEMTTQPNPPYRGDNVVVITLRDAAGKPVTGAQVTVSFFMPAMPAMGMAAMHAGGAAAARGGGIYQAAVALDSGGTWQATVNAVKDGRPLASRQFNVSVGGAM